MIERNTRMYGGPSKYVQGVGILADLPKYTARYGEKIYFIIDVFFFEQYWIEFQKVYDKQKVFFEKFEQEITKKKVETSSAQARKLDVDLVVGMGGGKALDLAKDVATSIGKPVFVVPTIAASDAPCSAMSVLYDEKGRHTGTDFHKTNPEMVVVDTAIIAAAPVRFLVAGIGDALATYFEAKASTATNSPNYIDAKYGSGYKRTLLGQAVAQMCYDTILADGVKAKLAVDAGVVTEALENIVETNILLSGIGFENMGCAGAHSIGAGGLSAVKSKIGALHGEKVAFGILCQMYLENYPDEEIEKIMGFYSRIGLPLTLGQLGVADDEATICKIADASFPEDWDKEPCLVTPDIVRDAIRYTDFIGKRYLECE